VEAAFVVNAVVAVVAVAAVAAWHIRDGTRFVVISLLLQCSSGWEGRLQRVTLMMKRMVKRIAISVVFFGRDAQWA
jgi:hypothetical protein